MPSAPTNAPVVVGAESTDAGRPAVAWAADEAALHRLPVRLIHAVDWPFGADQLHRARCPLIVVPGGADDE